MPRKKLKSHVTPYGHHAYLAFRECPRRYYFSYIYRGGMESKIGSVSTTMGTSYHAFVTTWHMTGNVQKAQRAAQAVLQKEIARWDIFKNPSKIDQVKEVLKRTTEGYPDFDKLWQRKNGKLKFLQCEEYAKVSVELPGFGAAPFTSRRDGVCLWQGEKYIFEVKLSIMDTHRMQAFHQLGGQCSGYIVTEQLQKSPCVGALIDHVRHLVTPQYFRKPVLRTDEILQDWKQSLICTYQDMQAANQQCAYNAHFDSCVGYTQTCAFRDVCVLDSPEKRRECLDTFYRTRT